jgi:hypothetical protein
MFLDVTSGHFWEYLKAPLNLDSKTSIHVTSPPSCHKQVSAGQVGILSIVTLKLTNLPTNHFDKHSHIKPEFINDSSKDQN